MADKKFSCIWDYFTVNDSNPNIAVCNLCKPCKSFSRDTTAKNYSTSLLIYHLKSKHPAEFKLYTDGTKGKAKEHAERLKKKDLWI